MLVLFGTLSVPSFLVGVFFGLVFLVFFKKGRRCLPQNRELLDSRKSCQVNGFRVPQETSSETGSECCKDKKVTGLRVLYGTSSGTAASFTVTLTKDFASLLPSASSSNVSSLDPEEELVSLTKEKTLLVIIMPSYDQGGPPEGAKWFYRWMEETSKDFR